MLKSDLYERLAQRFPQLSEKKDAGTAVSVILAAMQNALAGGQRIEIRDFGSFSVNTTPPRTGRNPKTGVSVLVPTRCRPHFKPGKALRERVALAPCPEATPPALSHAWPTHSERCPWITKPSHNSWKPPAITR